MKKCILPAIVFLTAAIGVGGVGAATGALARGGHGGGGHSLGGGEMGGAGERSNTGRDLSDTGDETHRRGSVPRV